MFITRKHLSRRTLLRGAGAAVALPLLDSMIPAGTALAQTAALPRSRFASIYIPHGATMDKWTPATDGTGRGRMFRRTTSRRPVVEIRGQSGCGRIRRRAPPVARLVVRRS